MLKNSYLLAGLAALTFASVANAQDIPLPGFGNTFTSALTRGFYFTAPVNCTIVGLEVPNESTQPNQVVEIIDFGTTAPPAFPATVTGTQLFYDNTTLSGVQIPTSIFLQAGNVYGVFGACNPAPASATSHNSYGTPAGPYSDVLFSNAGFPVTLTRMGTQSGIASNGGNQPIWSESAGPIGRVIVTLAGAGTTNTGSNDYYITTSGLPGFGAPAPQAVTPIQVGTPNFLVNGPSSAAGGMCLGVLSLLAPVSPGNVCLPPVGGAYASIPPVLACGGTTNQSWDITPGVFPITLFFGFCDAAGNFNQGVPVPAGFVGITGSTQAMFFDYTTGFVVTQAFDFVITP